jgi:hypothetical protein
MTVTHEGLIRLRDAPAALLKLTGSEADPVSIARARYRLVWDTVTKHEAPAVRIGKRWFIRSAELRTLADALGLTPPASRKASRARKAPAASSNEAVAA